MTDQPHKVEFVLDTDPQQIKVYYCHPDYEIGDRILNHVIFDKIFEDDGTISHIMIHKPIY